MPPEQNDNDVDKSQSNDDDAPKFVTADQLSQTVNSAITSHFKRFNGKLDERDKTLAASIVEQIRGSSDVVDDKDGDKTDGKKSPENVALQRQLTQLRNELKKAEEGRVQEATRGRNATLRSSVSGALGELGLTGSRLKGAMAMLYQDGKVTCSEDGQCLFVESEGLELPLADGLKTWIDTDDAKLFLPPKNVSGSGDRGAGGKVTNPKDRKAAAMAFLQKNLFK